MHKYLLHLTPVPTVYPIQQERIQLREMMPLVTCGTASKISDEYKSATKALLKCFRGRLINRATTRLTHQPPSTNGPLVPPRAHLRKHWPPSSVCSLIGRSAANRRRGPGFTTPCLLWPSQVWNCLGRVLSWCDISWASIEWRLTESFILTKFRHRQKASTEAPPQKRSTGCHQTSLLNISADKSNY